jgi:CRP-like cAMP-binding protein
MDRHAYIDERLAQIPLFQGLSKKELRNLSSLATRLEEPAGKVLTKEGQQGYEFIIVLEGEVEVRQHGEVIAKRGAGDYFGEIALLDNRPRTATVVAVTPVVIEVIERREFLGLVADNPEISQAIMATMAQRLEQLDESAS